MTSSDRSQSPRPSASSPLEQAAPRSMHGRGNWRSLVISMVIMTIVVFVMVALVPRPAQRERATVDVARSAAQLATEKGWPLATVRTGTDWHATSVGLAPDDKGVPTWQVGYHHVPGDDQYVLLAQTRSDGGVGEQDIAAWISRQTKAGREDGTVPAGRTTWSRRTATVDGPGRRIHRSLVADGPGAPGGLVTVLSGEVDDAVLELFASSLEVRPVPTPSVSATTTSARSSGVTTSS